MHSIRFFVFGLMAPFLPSAFFLIGLIGLSSAVFAQTATQAVAEKVDIDAIVKQVELSHKFRVEDLGKFEKESSAKNMEFLRERSKKEQLASHLRSNMEALKKHVELVNSGEKIADSHTILTNDQRLEVAKLAAAVFAKSDKKATDEARIEASNQAKKIDEDRNALSSSRYKEKEKIKAAADKEHGNFHGVFKPLVKKQGPSGLSDFALYEVAGSFSESMVNFMYKNGEGKRLRFGFSVNLEPMNIVKPKKKEDYTLLVESKKQLVLSTGRIFISIKTEADIKQGDLWKFFKGVTSEAEMQQLAEKFK